MNHYQPLDGGKAPSKISLANFRYKIAQQDDYALNAKREGTSKTRTAASINGF